MENPGNAVEDQKETETEEDGYGDKGRECSTEKVNW